MTEISREMYGRTFINKAESWLFIGLGSTAEREAWINKKKKMNTCIYTRLITIIIIAILHNVRIFRVKIIWKEKEEKESGSMIREHINKNIIKRNFNYKNWILKMDAPVTHLTITFDRANEIQRASIPSVSWLTNVLALSTRDAQVQILSQSTK